MNSKISHWAESQGREELPIPSGATSIRERQTSGRDTGCTVGML